MRHMKEKLFLVAMGLGSLLSFLIGVTSLALTQTVSIRPWSWHAYWQLTGLEWVVGVICIMAGALGCCMAVGRWNELNSSQQR